MLYDSESGMSTPSYWEEALDIDVSSIKVMRVPGLKINVIAAQAII